MIRSFSVIKLLLLLTCLLVSGTSCHCPTSTAEVETLAHAPTVRLLVVGRDRAAGLTDSIMLVSLESGTGRVGILQIPRDTYAEYTNRDYRKLNGAMNALGLAGMKQFLSGALGITLDYAVALDLEAVIALVDAVGGVEVEIPEDMCYSDPAQGLEIRLEAGARRLSGREAEQFLRYRSGYADADLGRMDAQKQFLQAFLMACKEAEGGALTGALWRILPHLQTDLPIHKAVELLRALQQCNEASMTAASAPGQAVQGSSGAWYYSLNRAGMIAALNEYLWPTPQIDDAAFDVNRVFDREENPDFHNVYITPHGG